MNCRRARKLLTHGPGDDPALARHLASCAECERFAERWAALRQGITDHRITVTPDAGFAARVTSRLGAPADPFVWAARRLLPVTMALTLVLGGWCLLRTPTPSSLADELADGDLLIWVASGDEEER
jgi:hypothetical protein